MNLFLPNETVYCRFTGEAFRVVSCNGCVAELSDGTARPVGELARLNPNRPNCYSRVRASMLVQS